MIGNLSLRPVGLPTHGLSARSAELVGTSIREVTAGSAKWSAYRYPDCELANAYSGF